MRTLRCVVFLVVATLGLSLFGCSSSRRTSTVVVVDRDVVAESKHGPPPHAPAHGYRAKHQDVDLVFDSGLGVYTVVGHRGCYYRNSRFYRRHGDQWEISNTIRGPWRTTSISTVPNGLVAERSKSEKSHKKDKW